LVVLAIGESQFKRLERFTAKPFSNSVSVHASVLSKNKALSVALQFYTTA
jgi:hypothetical protein